MKKLLPLLFFVFLAMEKASAQERIFVRAGEHANYSRLVLQVPPDLPWEFRLSGRKATLLLNETSSELDITEVYDRIPRTRILSLDTERSEGGAALKMTLGCDCLAEAQIESGMLVIDVSDNQPDLALNNGDDNAEPLDGNLSASLSPAPRPKTQSTNLAENLASDQPELTTNVTVESSETTVSSRTSNVSSDEVTERLLSQLNKAAEQGLIQLAETAQNIDEAPPPNTDERLETAEAAPVLDRVVQDIDGLEAMADRFSRELEKENLGLSVTVEVPQTQTIRSGPANVPEEKEEDADDIAENEHCIDSDLLNISDWSDNRPAAVQISELRGKVFGEFDKADQNTAFDLVRLYLAHGFGVEAQALIVDLKLGGQEAKILNELALVIESRDHVPDGFLDKAAGCGGNNDMWRAAALSTNEILPLPDPESVVKFFSQMPILVRRIIGPKLVDSLLVRGQTNVAKQIFAIIDRSPGEETAPIRLARAKLEHQDGQILEAEIGYASIIHKGGIESVQAAVLLTESILSRGASTPQLLIQDLEALAYLYRGTENGLNLRVAEIKAKAGSDRLKDALDIVDKELGRSENWNTDILGAADKILNSATSAKYGTGEFAIAVFEYNNIILNPLISPETRLNIAKEILSSGLPKKAMEILEVDSDYPASGHQLVAAQASLAMGLSTETLDFLSQNSQPEAVQIRAQALTHAGRYEEALEEILQMQEEQANAEFAWRAGNWDLALLSNRRAIKDFAEFMLGRQRAASPSIDVLAEIGVVSNSDNILNSTQPSDSAVSLNNAIQATENSVSIRSYLAQAMEQF